MDQKILVTICNYNHSKYLKQAIESIQDQTYSNLDICVVDDGSEDISAVHDIVYDKMKTDNRIRFLNFEKNYGKWHALNEAIRTSDAQICTSHDADDVSLAQRIEYQYKTLTATNTIHNLCSFYHCWNENDISNKIGTTLGDEQFSVIEPENVTQLVLSGFQHPSINHYYTGEVETAGVSAMFARGVYDMGIRFNPPDVGLRTLLSEDSDFNFRVTSLLGRTSVLTEKLYLYRRNTSTNQETL